MLYEIETKDGMDGFGERIRLVMHEKRKTQRALAQESGITEAYLCRVMKGMNDPTVKKAVRIAQALNVSLDWLCGI